jgi:hypothetical protein|tara:strand:- start:6253 stop:8406 length:2154 start_codon:yes stop_codon:yes gene_type:complete
MKRKGRIDKIEALAVIPVPDCHLYALWWCLGYYVAPTTHWRKDWTPTQQRRRAWHRFAERIGVDDETREETRATFWGFWRMRGKVQHSAAKAAHPQYELWWKAFRQALLARIAIWIDKDRIPGAWGHHAKWDWDDCARTMRVPSKTLRDWYANVENGWMTLERPELVNRHVRRRRNATRTIQYRMEEEAQRELTDLHESKIKAVESMAAGATGLECNLAGVTATAADVTRTPRKTAFHEELQEGVHVEGGELVVLAKYRPHEGQRSFHDSGARERWIVAGRRGGKTRAGAEEMVRCGLTQPGSLNWVIGPTYPMLDHAQRAVLSDTAIGYHKSLTNLWLKRERKLYLCNGSLIEFRSAEWEETLRGGGLDNAWFDEPQLIKDSAYKIIRAATLETQGRIYGTGTPFGRGHWTFREWAKGADADWHDVASWRFPSTLNPLVTAEEMERERRGSPAAWFRQEFLAEFVDGVASVFGDLSGVIVPHRQHRHGNVPVVLGVDLGKQKDFTAIIALASSGQVVETRRFRRESWSKQRETLLEMCAERDRPPVVVDSAGTGDAFVEALDAEGLYVIPICTSAANKKNTVIEQLMIDVEAGRLWIPADEEVLIAELMQYRRGVTKTGRVSYAAPEGLHDDMVIALALANWGVQRLMLAQGISTAASASDYDPVSGPRAPQSVRSTLFRHGSATEFGGGTLGGGAPSYQRGLFGGQPQHDSEEAN